MKLLFIFYALGPALLGYALAWLLKYPHDWTGPAVVIPLSLALTWLTQTAGTRCLRRTIPFSFDKTLTATRIAGAAMGPLLFFLMYFVLLK